MARRTLIDDDTPWVFHYQGLWGNDTADPLGGERGPAGPRYEKSGLVRQPWGDVVGWSGLSKVAPNHQVATDLILHRLELLETEADAVTRDLDARRTQLRADVASGVERVVGTGARVERAGDGACEVQRRAPSAPGPAAQPAARPGAARPSSSSPSPGHRGDPRAAPSALRDGRR